MKQEHLKINSKDITPYVLLPGDPGRVNIIGKFLKDFKIISKNREYKIGVGIYKNKKITVCSTGIGCPSTAIAVEELINAGAKYLIRVGTCGGSWQKNIEAGSLIIPTASIRDEGTTDEYIPKGFPAVANFYVLMSLIKAAKKQRLPFFQGINRTHDSFFGSQQSIKKWGTYLYEDQWQKYDTPILSSDMETSALFIIATLRGVQAGAILVANANPENLKDRILNKKQKTVMEIDPKLTNAGLKKSIKVALESIECL